MAFRYFRDDVYFIVTLKKVTEENVTAIKLLDRFIAFIEENKWSFGGGYRTIIDGYYINDDGTKGEYVLDN